MLIALLTLSACQAPPGPDAYLGEWFGPEGTSLRVTQNADYYNVLIRNLDGTISYPADVKDGAIEFTRDGKTHALHFGSGVETGMKWLADKKSCVIVQPNEGYCRD